MPSSLRASSSYREAVWSNRLGNRAKPLAEDAKARFYQGPVDVVKLARPAVMDSATFGSHDYSKEELVAEMGASFLCGHAGIETATLENAASYIDSWLHVLRGDSRMVVQAATHAQKAADLILGHTSESASDLAEDEHGDAAQVA